METTTLMKTPEEYWVAVEELKFSYHNGYI